MITKELEENKKCIIYASEYHLEMILLPYIKERIEDEKFVIFTEKNMEETLDTLLTKVNLEKIIKEKIKNIKWMNDDEKNINKLQEYVKENKHINVVISGEFDYIKKINNKIKDIKNTNVEIIDCFHIEDPNVNIEEIISNYRYILNTQKI